MTMRPWWHYSPIVPFWVYKSLKEENRELKKELHQAMKNDFRDELTGQYVSRKKGSFTCG